MKKKRRPLFKFESVEIPQGEFPATLMLHREDGRQKRIYATDQLDLQKQACEFAMEWKNSFSEAQLDHHFKQYDIQARNEVMRQSRQIGDRFRHYLRRSVGLK